MVGVLRLTHAQPHHRVKACWIRSPISAAKSMSECVVDTSSGWAISTVNNLVTRAQ